MKPTRSDHLTEAALALRGLSRETSLVLNPDGVFLLGSQPIAHPGVAEAFACWIERSEEGRYVLRNDLHYVYVEVQGAPLHVSSLEVVEAPEGPAIKLRLRGGERWPLRPETVRLGPAGFLYADVRDGTWPARFLPRAMLELAPWIEESQAGPVLRLGAAAMPIKHASHPLRPVQSP